MRTSLMALAPVVAGGAALGDLFVRGRARLQLSRAKHPSLSGHARWSRRIAGLIPFYEYGDGEFFRSDDAPEAVVQQRRDGFARLSQLYRDRYPRTVAMTRRSSEIISDLQFTASYRVPFQFSRRVRDELATGSFLQSAQGTTVTDLDGNVFYDLTGSYGVNLFGHDFYKQCMQAGIERTRDLGVSLGAYHPVVAENVTRLRTISGLDEVSFHMSGTEAVMQAVRLARYHTRRPKLVRFCGAYHGWWGEVQPGVGNPTPADRTLTLAEMSQRTLAVLRRRRDIACVLVNPLQALHPNGSAPSDSTLVAGGRQAAFDREAYAAWLRELRSVCDARGIVLIFDEVFVGFRLAPHGAREYFGVQPDMITYGKTLGGGLPVGVLCGGHRLMRRFRDDRPADICFARGTFNAHPQVMGAMHEFLRRIEEPDIRALYEGLDQLWGQSRGQSQCTPRQHRPAGAGGEHVLDLDRALHVAVALPLDAAILPAGAGPGAELGRHRPADLQPRLYGWGFRGGGRLFRGRLRRDAAGWLVVGSRRRRQQGNAAPGAERIAVGQARPAGTQ